VGARDTGRDENRRGLHDGGQSRQCGRSTTPVAEKVQFHKETEENGVAHMRQMSVVDIAPEGTVTLKPGDMHMMLVGLKQPLKEGETVPLTLTFEKAGKIDVTASVAKVGAMQPGDMSNMHDHMH
jgi:copper(I)-binding protein